MQNLKQNTNLVKRNNVDKKQYTMIKLLLTQECRDSLIFENLPCNSAY